MRRNILIWSLALALALVEMGEKEEGMRRREREALDMKKRVIHLRNSERRSVSD